MMVTVSRPKVTFGLIVLNGEPFVRYNLRALYPFAHEIIVVEGAALAAEAVATPGGHSIDGTLEALREFKRSEDPANKLKIVTAEDHGHPNGFWPGEKDEQSRAYATAATGDYLWQIDIDEFYKAADMERILCLLQEDVSISAVSFRIISFWGGFGYLTDGPYMRGGAGVFHRLFRWGPGFQYTNHRPPTVYDAEGRDLRSLHWVTGEDMARQGILLYHYSLVFPKQVMEKCQYYSVAPWAPHSRQVMQWVDDVFFRLRDPFRVHNVYAYPSWLERFHGSHPAQIEAMRRDIASGQLTIATRRTDDIEQVLRSPKYWLCRAYLRHPLISRACNALRTWLMEKGHTLRISLPGRAVHKALILPRRVIEEIRRWLVERQSPTRMPHHEVRPVEAESPNLGTLRVIAKQLPVIPFLYRAFRSRYLRYQVIPGSTEDVFTGIYKSNPWGGKESVSGAGSDFDQTTIITREIPVLLSVLNVATMLDIPCGDFHWMNHVDLRNIDYTGADIVKEIIRKNKAHYARRGIRFRHLNLIKDRLPRVDLVLCRDCLVHLSFSDIDAALENLCKSESVYVLTTTFTDRNGNEDIVTGGWRPINLEMAPFVLPRPLKVINEECTQFDNAYKDKALGLWKIADIRESLRRRRA